MVVLSNVATLVCLLKVVGQENVSFSSLNSCPAACHDSEKD